ncbi:unnamed protein product [Rangifer tarandus platyrhynchus]|uniref:Uncharacterized protein n=1 Tax=Rangifer tarandus platyrhynchus TaxID=3082113 RepID=A0AC59ZW51_RANTA
MGCAGPTLTSPHCGGHQRQKDRVGLAKRRSRALRAGALTSPSVLLLTARPPVKPQEAQQTRLSVCAPRRPGEGEASLHQSSGMKRHPGLPDAGVDGHSLQKRAGWRALLASEQRSGLAHSTTTGLGDRVVPPPAQNPGRAGR